MRARIKSVARSGTSYLSRARALLSRSKKPTKPKAAAAPPPPPPQIRIIVINLPSDPDADRRPFREKPIWTRLREECGADIVFAFTLEEARQLIANALDRRIDLAQNEETRIYFGDLGRVWDAGDITRYSEAGFARYPSVGGMVCFGGDCAASIVCAAPPDSIATLCRISAFLHLFGSVIPRWSAGPLLQAGVRPDGPSVSALSSSDVFRPTVAVPPECARRVPELRWSPTLGMWAPPGDAWYVSGASTLLEIVGSKEHTAGIQADYGVGKSVPDPGPDKTKGKAKAKGQGKGKQGASASDLEIAVDKDQQDSSVAAPKPARKVNLIRLVRFREPPATNPAGPFSPVDRTATEGPAADKQGDARKGCLKPFDPKTLPPPAPGVKVATTEVAASRARPGEPPAALVAFGPAGAGTYGFVGIGANLQERDTVEITMLKQPLRPWSGDGSSGGANSGGGDPGEGDSGAGDPGEGDSVAGDSGVGTDPDVGDSDGARMEATRTWSFGTEGEA